MPGRPDGPGPARDPAGLATLLLPAGLVLAAVNLRPAITSLGALLDEARDGLGMSGTVAGLLASVPTLCFALFGVAAPRLARRFGPAAVVCAGMAAIAAGTAVRPFLGTTAGFLAAGVLALAGIALSNVLMPVLVKRYFPRRVGPMTGLYSMALGLGAALAAAVTVPVTGVLGGDWRTGLAVWAVPAVIAVLLWLPHLRDRAAPEPAAGPAGVPAASARPVRVTRSRTAWALAVFFGLQAGGAYVAMGWMPQIFRDAGVPGSTAGVLVALTMGFGVPLSFVLPSVAARMRSQGVLAAALGACGLAGYAGLHFAPAGGAWLWAILLGLTNCSFPLALTLIGMRARSAAGVTGLSAFVQSAGYLIAVPVPLLVGVLYQHSGGWGVPLGLMTALLVPQIVAGTLAGRDRFVEDGS
ncbi:CynX/NimT family MFS transporter [Streptomyces sp. GC420]|nr:CynX/NimT family MFS transporter [Streptomyces sp. GC420]